MSNIPSEKQLESTFEVIAWLKRDRSDYRVLLTVTDFEELLKQEVDRCLSE